MEHGNMGDSKPVGAGVIELRINFGPGYRIYYGKDGTKLIILLVGGSKHAQANDIKRAQKYWINYNKQR